MCQKSYNFVDAFICYKQKCKVVSLNLAHATLYMPFSIGYFGGSLEPSLYISNGFLEDYAMANRECDAMVER